MDYNEASAERCFKFFDEESQCFIYSQINQEVLYLFYKFRDESFRRGTIDENGDK